MPTANRERLARRSAGDALMLAAISVCGLGYAEGAQLSRKLGGWQVISWALVLSLPVMALLMAATLPSSFAGVGWPAWTGLAYVSVFSMLIGFIFWYRAWRRAALRASGNCNCCSRFSD